MKKLFLLLFAVISIGVCASAQTRTITGTVVDAQTDEPLMGVLVEPAGEKKGVVTDIDGHFSITIAPNVKELTVSYIGYTTINVKPEPNMTIELLPSSEMLDVVVVTGYGSGKKLGSLTGSVGVVNSDQLAHVTTPSFVDALQGKVAGLSVLSASGDPSANMTDVRLRGVSSLNAGTTPLFILDGAPVTQTVFATLNPNDIESVTVLKDAASVAIYGSRAANGVIVITSKKGKYGQTAKVNIRAKMGWSQLTTDKTEMMNSEQYVKYRDLIGQPVSDAQRYAALDLGISTDWRSQVFNGHAPTYSLEAGISGGTEACNYYLSLNHLDQDGIIDQSSMRRETLRLSLTSRVNDWFRAGVQINLGYMKYEQNNESNAGYSNVYALNPVTFARMAMPMDSPRYYSLDENGQPIWGEKAYYLHYTQMPTPELIQKYRSVWRNRTTLNGNLFEEISPIKGLIIRAQQAVDAYDYRIDNMGYAHDVYYSPMGDQYGEEEANPQGIVEGYNQQGFSRYYQFTYTNTAEYRFKLENAHNVTLLLGQESIIAKSESFGAFTSGQSDIRQPYLGQGTSVLIGDVSQSIGQSVMNSFFLSGSYNYLDKYFLDLNVRRDGSSKFAPGHRWATFWSAGAMWDMKQEAFMRPYTWLNTAKLRVSYGTTGNSDISEYSYFGLIGSTGMYNQIPGWGISQAPNYDFSWETVAGLDVGLAVGLFNKVNIDAAFYNKNTNDMLIVIPYSATTGVSGGWGNVASMRNTGFDFQGSYIPIQNKNWYWEVRANFNYNFNEITKLYDGLDELPFPSSNIIYKVGKTAKEFYMVRYAGVDPRDGKQQWYTREGNITKVYNAERDAVCIGGKSPYSPWSGGFGTTVSWKGLSLQVDFNWALGKYMINNDLYFCQNNNFATEFNQTTKMLDVWTKPGQITDIPAPGQVIQFDTRMLENASFMRVKNLILMYNFPNKLTKRMGLSGLAVSFTGRNLYTFTSFSGYDPEPETNVIKFFYPNTRQFEFGLDVSF